jgi:hypothetical protein
VTDDPSGHAGTAPHVARLDCPIVIVRLVAHMANGEVIPLRAEKGLTPEAVARAMAEPGQWPNKRWWQAGDGSWVQACHVIRLEVQAGGD